MIFDGITKAEAFFFHTNDERHWHSFIEMEIDDDENVFYVRSSDYDGWEWRFHYTTSNYELVKHIIFDVAFDANDMEEIIDALEKIFADVFREIVDWCYYCEAGCESCECK